jgi:two-component system sensor histidine kinase QseC
MIRSSMRARLRWLILGVLLIVLLPLALISFQRTIGEVDELSDGRLAESARALDVLVQHAGMGSLRGVDAGILVPSPEKDAAGKGKRTKTYEAEVGFQVYDTQGQLVLATQNVIGMRAPKSTDAAFDDLRYADYRWRVFVLRDTVSGVVIRTAERYDSRDEIMHALWLDHGLPLLVGLPLLALLVGWAVKRGLRPLDSLTRALSLREPGSRQPISLDDAPLELQPVLAALNRQLERQEDALERERRFNADVAHELRTPLASVMINLENVMASDDPRHTHESLAGARHSVAMLARRVEQLLALARLETGAAGQRVAVDLVEVAGDVIDELAPVISDSAAELDFTRQGGAVVVQGYEVALATMLRNLLENALRHVPPGGQIRLSVEQGEHEAIVEVIDNGPGIPPEHRAAVFARFHREASSRGEGYGLGLSIVQRAAELHAARIELLDSTFDTGLRVRVTLPASI